MSDQGEQMKNETKELTDFMNNPFFRVAFAKMICFFSVPSPGLKAKYLHPRELKAFWESLSWEDQHFWADSIVRYYRMDGQWN